MPTHVLFYTAEQCCKESGRSTEKVCESVCGGSTESALDKKMRPSGGWTECEEGHQLGQVGSDCAVSPDAVDGVQGPQQLVRHFVNRGADRLKRRVEVADVILTKLKTHLQQ